MEAVSQSAQQDPIDFAKQTIRQEARALFKLAGELGADFQSAITQLESCRGAVIITGMGKAGLIGQKISATFCSTGTRSHFLHPAEAIHGDLGRVSEIDCVLALSMSGETEELLRVLPSLSSISAGIVSITSSRASSLGRASQCVLELGSLEEAGSFGLAPSTSTTAMLALGDALALTLSERRDFRSHDFARYHPGGSLGRKLMKVQDIMRPLAECRVAQQTSSVCDTFVTRRQATRRTGAVMIVDEQQRLQGVFTDSDLARLLESQSAAALDRPVREVMTVQPITITVDEPMPNAIHLLAENQISELPVLDSEGKPAGMIDITDVLGWLPQQTKTDAEPEAVTRINANREASGEAESNEQLDEELDEELDVAPNLIPFPGHDTGAKR